MQEQYLPILVMLIIATGFAAVALTISWLLGPSRPDANKNETYECGVSPVGDARERFSVRFYVVAMLFIVFDLETVFMFPWAVVFKQLPTFYFLQMLIFLVILTVGLVYEWRMGALDWNTSRGKMIWRSGHDKAA
ncbi:MAG: NADH-quinone oxidoreductase subunit A [Candidatus Eisenbacteria bacterium]|uniref:NADH-quinone oxidoreductase subunit A n=1 Tax=Eiseniibacteriota bacterium TaxID=2212470 RepID=A0A7Y2E7U4_UNCEI|nr:NADH-quinone oxidoreductase subunit A [Candidatus Eisenbacteria bacterium]